MPGKKTIKNKIRGIQNTQKITKAMQLISAVKMRKLKHHMLSILPYLNNLIKLINNIRSANLEYQHSYFQHRLIKRVGYIVISTDKGLCGSLNNNLFKLVIKKIKLNKNIKVFLAIIGAQAYNFFNELNINIVAQNKNLGDFPKISDLININKVMLDLYNKNKIDKLFIVNNKFINNIYYHPIIEKLLPLTAKEIKYNQNNWDYIYEPEPKKILDNILKRYIESKIYYKLIENIVSEQSARMIAMKKATDNGENIIKELELKNNKIRQASITQELNEIISGSLQFS